MAIKEHLGVLLWDAFSFVSIPTELVATFDVPWAVVVVVGGGSRPVGLLSQMCPDDPCRRNEYADLSNVVMNLFIRKSWDVW